MEEWRDVVGYEGLYQVSNIGRVSSLYFGKEKIIKQFICKGGYVNIHLHKNNKIKTFRVHRLVVITFIINIENKTEVNHINGIKTDNRVENLEWVTRSENLFHKYRVLGYKNNFQINHPHKGKFGKDNHLSKTIGQYDMIGNFINKYGSTREVQRQLGISQSNISACCRGKYKQSGGFIWKFI